MSKAHATFSASGSDRWLNCPGSIRLSEDAPKSEESDYAQEGTEAHACLEFLLGNFVAGKLPEARKMAANKWNPEMIKHAFEAVNIIQQDSGGATLLCETKVDLAFVKPEMFGTVDAAKFRLFDRLTIYDYKYGAGIAVDPDENTQLIYYALGIAHKYHFNFTEVELVIIQPRADHEAGPVRSWVMSIEDLMAWEEKFRDGVEACEDISAPLAAGDWCQFCPAQTICPKLSTEAFSEAQMDFDPAQDENVLLPVVNMIPVETLGNVLQAAKRIEKWIEAVKEHALHVAKLGAKIPGYKVVQKRSTRKWVGEDVEKFARNAFGDKAFKTSLLSPAQLEEALGKKAKIFVTSYSSSQSSGVTLAPDSDKRLAFNELEAEYEDVTESEDEMPTKKKAVKTAKKATTKAKPKTTKRKGRK